MAHEGIILASQSPRRRELMTELGIPFSVHPPDFVEQSHPELPAEQEVLELARGKARSLAHRFPKALILGCDTLVVLGKKKLGKPSNPTDALAMLMELSGRTHRVLTGMYLSNCSHTKSWEGVEETEVVMRDFSEDEAMAYVSTGESLDKAGAYGIQGQGSALVSTIRGDYFNVVGLPLKRLVGYLKEAGIKIPGSVIIDLDSKNRNFPGTL